MAKKENYTWRLSVDLRKQLEGLALEEMRREGRFVPLAEIIERCVLYGKTFVEREVRMDLTVPHTAKTEKERLLHTVRQVFEKGFESFVQPGEAA